MRVLICGDRYWSDWNTIRDYINTLAPDTVVIEGDARGADRIAGTLAEERGLKVIRESAKWELYGNAAGPIRNKKMLDDHKPDLVVAFHYNITNSRGTKNMLMLAKLAGVPTILIGDMDEGL